MLLQVCQQPRLRLLQLSDKAARSSRGGSRGRLLPSLIQAAAHRHAQKSVTLPRPPAPCTELIRERRGRSHPALRPRRAQRSKNAHARSTRHGAPRSPGATLCAPRLCDAHCRVAAGLRDSGQRGAKARKGPVSYIPRLASNSKRILTTSAAAGSSPLSCAEIGGGTPRQAPRGNRPGGSVRARRGRQHGTWDPSSAPQCGVSVGIGVTCAASVGVDTGIPNVRPLPDLSPPRSRESDSVSKFASVVYVVNYVPLLFFKVKKQNPRQGALPTLCVPARAPHLLVLRTSGASRGGPRDVETTPVRHRCGSCRPAAGRRVQGLVRAGARAEAGRHGRRE
jgi:hypothetical protein